MDLFVSTFCSPSTGNGLNNVFVVVVVREEMQRREPIEGEATPGSRRSRVKEPHDNGDGEENDENDDEEEIDDEIDDDEEILATTSL